MRFMIKSLAPILGDFHGRGQTLDGTEISCEFHGEEIIPDLCYGLRLKIVSLDGGEVLANSYVVFSQDGEDTVNIQYIDGKEHMGPLHCSGSGALKGDSSSRVFQFEASRTGASAGNYRLSFDVNSAQQFRLEMEASSRGGAMKELWHVNLERKLPRLLFAVRAA